MNTALDSQAPGELYCTSCERTYQVGDRCPADGTRLMKLKLRIDPLIGRDLDGRYTVIEKLGQGGMGAVYRAQQHSVDREVAIKVVNASLVSEPEVIKRFLREAKIASKLSHPNAVGVMDFAQTDDGVFYLVMELVSGRTLDEEFKKHGVFAAERAIRIGIQICDALEGAHSLSIIHRDLKPSNVMLMNAGRDIVKVLDFGLAKSVNPDHTNTTMTNAGSVVGTPAFMPPELARGEACDATSDLYSLGVILYLLVSGRLPFAAESVHEMVALHGGDDEAPALSEVPVALAAVIQRLLRKDRAERFRTAVEVRSALEEALARPSQVPMLAWDTNPSVGPFPATGSQFPLVDAPKVARGKPAGRSHQPRSPTEVERLISADTMNAATALDATSVSATSAPMPATRAKRWPIVAGALAVVAVAVIAFAMRSSSPTPATLAPPTAPMPHATTTPAPTTPATTAPVTTAPVTTTTAPTTSTPTTPGPSAGKAATVAKPTVKKPGLKKPSTPVKPPTPAASAPEKPVETRSTKPAPDPTKQPAPPF